MRTAEADIKREFAAQQGLLQQLLYKPKWFDSLIEQYLGPHVQPEVVYGVMIILATLLVLRLFFG